MLIGRAAPETPRSPGCAWPGRGSGSVLRGVLPAHHYRLSRRACAADVVLAPVAAAAPLRWALNVLVSCRSAGWSSACARPRGRIRGPRHLHQHSRPLHAGVGADDAGPRPPGGARATARVLFTAADGRLPRCAALVIGIWRVSGRCRPCCMVWASGWSMAGLSARLRSGAAARAVWICSISSYSIPITCWRARSTIASWPTAPRSWNTRRRSASLLMAVVALRSGAAATVRGQAGCLLTLGFAALSLGPFIHIAGINTHVPGPWALLRYVPLVGAARTPTRFSIVAALGLAILLAGALAALGRRFPEHRRLVAATVGLTLVLELAPAPRTLYSASIPSIYTTFAADPRPVRVAAVALRRA